MNSTRRWMITCVCLAVALAGLATSASAADTQTTVADAADMYTSSSAPNEGYGTSTSLAVYGTPGITSVLRFVIPATPAGKTLTSARLRIRTTTIASAGSANTINVRTAADTWTETGTTYTTRPALGATVLGTLPGGSVPDTAYSIALNSTSVGALTGSTTLALQGTGNDSLWIWSRRAAASLRPVLELTYSDSAPSDTTPPSAPNGLTANASGGSIALGWAASTDDTAVTSYTVHRSTTTGFTPSPQTAIATVTGTSYTDPGRPSGTWHYRVVAGDAAGNTSDPSSTASATIPPSDTTPPSAPGGLTANASGSSIALGWAASTDDTAVTSYTVHRSTTTGFTPSPQTAIATVTGTTYTDPGRPSGTWYYRVVAGDAAGNTSNPSGTASAVIASVDTVVQVADTADMYTSASAPNEGYGTSTSLAAYGTPVITSLLRFVVPATTPGKTLTGARLRVRTTTIASAGTANVTNVRTASDSWTETGTTYATRPALGSSVLGSLPGGSSPDTAYWITLSPAALAAQSGSTTLALQGTGNDSLWVWSRRAAASLRPVLELTYSGSATPDPLDPTDPTATSTVVAASDIVCPPGSEVTPLTCKHNEVRALIDTVAPDRFIAPGDLAQGLGSYEEFTAPGRYADTFGSLGPKTLPVIGNHEAYDPQAGGYWNYFYGPGVTTGRYGQRPVGYYSAVIGSWRFIGLDSECDPGGLAGGCDVGSPQYEWLRSLLDRDTTPCTIVAYHRPRWTTGNGHGPYLPMAPLWDLMASRGVDVVLSGHNHVAETFKPIGVSGTAAQPTLSPTGIRAFTVGIGGDSQYSFTAAGTGQFSALESRARGTFGVLKLTLQPTGYSWAFLPIQGSSFVNSSTTGAFSGTDSCH